MLWHRTNPGGGGSFSSVGAGPSGIILAGSDISGAYMSNDQGASWAVIGARSGFLETHVSSIGFDPKNEKTMLLGSENGIYRSSDKGLRWFQTLQGGYITEVIISPAYPQIGYAAYHPEYDSNQGSVYKTTDNGMNWSRVSADLPSGLRILKLVSVPFDEDKIYLLSGDGRFACGAAKAYRSINGGIKGINWFAMGEQLGDILDISLDPQISNTLYLTTMNADCDNPFYWDDLDGALYKSINNGESWGSPIMNRTGVIWIKRDNSDVRRLIDPMEPYPWIESAGTWTSINGGQSWRKSGDVSNWDTFFNKDAFWSYGTAFDGIVKSLGEDLSNPDRLFWINSQWIFGTDNGGITFNNLFTNEVSPGKWQSRGFDNVVMFDIEISPADPNTIYVGWGDLGIWRSDDSGKSWQSSN